MSATTRQSSAQAYLQQHRVAALFEELMATLIRDQPPEPLLHLMRSLQRKAADRGLLKQQAAADALDASLIGAAPLRPSTAAPTKSAAAAAAASGRTYDKPWLAASSTGATVGKSGGLRKSSSGNVAASVLQTDVGLGGFERQRQSSRSSITPPNVDAANLWSAGEATAPAPATAAEIAAAEADILGSEFRLARSAKPAAASSTTAGVEASDSGAQSGLDSSPANARGQRRSALGARQAAREARMKQLEASLAESSSAAAKSGTMAAAASGSTAAADSAFGSGADGEDEFEADGVLLIEDADALAAEGVRVTRRPGIGRAPIATVRQRADTRQSADLAGPAAEPQVRMTFCGRCFALINQEDEAAALAAAGAASAPGTARGSDVGGFGFGAISSGAVLPDEDAYDDLEPFAAPQTGRTNATMTEVTDIESASQVTGPRRPSWGGGNGGGGSASARSGAASKQKRSTRQHHDSSGSVSSNRGGRGFEPLGSREDAGFGAGAVGGGGGGGGWGAAAAAVAAAEADLSDQETERDRHLQQDVRLY